MADTRYARPRDYFTSKLDEARGRRDMFDYALRAADAEMSPAQYALAYRRMIRAAATMSRLEEYQNESR